MTMTLSLRFPTRALLAALACVVTLSLHATPAPTQPIPVELVKAHGHYTLLRDGQPYFIQGAGGTDRLEQLAAIGGNSVRTWGAPEREFLDRAHAAGLSVCVGLWVEHERHGFDYSDDAAVAAQIARHKADIDRLKDHPAVLLWAIGNEVELESTNPRVWDVVEAVAAYAKQVDPHHPTMTVVAHAPADAIAHIRERCPSVDILGCNSYGGIGVLPTALAAAGWDRPYIVSEWGANGSWEVDKTTWGAEIEATSTEKAAQFAARHSRIASDRRLCLGGYVFLWGQKQENTPTWFGIFTEDGRATEALEVLQFVWSGARPASPAPRVANLRINDQEPLPGFVATPGETLHARFALTRGNPTDVRVHWEILPESTDKRIGGDREQRPAPLLFDTEGEDFNHLAFTAPEQPGPYRLFLYVYGPKHTVATANFPFFSGAP